MGRTAGQAPVAGVVNVVMGAPSGPPPGFPEVSGGVTSTSQAISVAANRISAA